MSRRYRALLVGNANFPEDPHGLPALNGPLADIRTFGRALSDGDVGVFAPDDVQLLPDRGVRDLRERLDEFFASAARDDVLLFYYSGHGQLDLDNRLHLCAHDTTTSSLHSTALKADDLNELLRDCAAMSTIIVLDCCHSGAFKGTLLASKGTGAGPAGMIAGHGRYVLASSRSTQLALDTTTAGQLSPFTEQLVRGLREAPSDGELTVVELYRQVHRWLIEARGPVPQLRFYGEGEVIIARRGSSRLPLPPRDPATRHPPGWAAHRVRASGVDCVLRVGNGADEHTVEYGALPGDRALVLVDGRQVYRDVNLFECEFPLGRDGVRARLTVTESDLQLRVDGQQVYRLRQAASGSDDHREELSAAIRATLLGYRADRRVVRLGIVPHIPVSDFSLVRAKAGRAVTAMSAGPVIAVATFRPGRLRNHTGERVWFTDRAVHVRGRSDSVTVPYERLAAATVVATGPSVAIDEKDIAFTDAAIAEPVAELVSSVKNAVVYQDIGVGEPPPVHRFSGRHHPVELHLCLVVTLWMTGLAAVQGLVAALPRRDLLKFFVYPAAMAFVAFFAGLVLLAAAMVGGILLSDIGVRATARRAMIFTAAATVVYSAAFTWPQALLDSTGDLPLVGWTVAFGGAPAIVIGGVDTAAIWAQVWGAVFVAAGVFLAAVTPFLLRRRQLRQPV